MACRGVHFALTDEDRAKLLQTADSDGDVVEFVQEDLEERWDREWLCETDKAWDAIHRCLTGGTLAYDDSAPLNWCILGRSQLHAGDDYIVSFIDAEDVAAVANAIEAFSENDFLARYEAIDPDDYGVELSDEDFGYTWENFVSLREFYHKAAAARRSVIFTVDQ